MSCAVFFCFRPSFYTIGICIPMTSKNRWCIWLYCKNGAKMDSFSDFPQKFTYFHPSKCANKFGMVSKTWKASL